MKRQFVFYLFLVFAYVWGCVYVARGSSWQCYFPINVGNKWLYVMNKEGSSGCCHRKIEVIGKQKVNGVDCFVLVHTNYGRVIGREYIYTNKGGIFVYYRIMGNNGRFYKPPLPIFKFPLKVGSKWKQNPAGRGFNFEAVGEEDVKVPAGTFYAVKIKMSGISCNGAYIEILKWYAEDVGMVMEECFTPQGHIISKLEEYKIVE